MTSTFPDLFGNPVTSASKEAVENFSKAVEAYVCTRESCLGYLKRAVELDPNFVLAHCFLVGELLLSDKRKLYHSYSSPIYCRQ